MNNGNSWLIISFIRSKIAFIIFSLITSSFAQEGRPTQSLENFIIQYFQQSQDAFPLIGLPAPNHCELTPLIPTDNSDGKLQANKKSPPPYLTHLPESGPHLWPTCSFEELTFDCHIFNPNDQAIFFLGPSSIVGALPTNILRSFFSRITREGRATTDEISQEMAKGTSIDQIIGRLRLNPEKISSSPQSRLQILGRLFEEEHAISQDQNAPKQKVHEVEILNKNPKCDLNPFYLNYEKEKNLLQLCPAIAILPNVVVASLYARNVFEHASPSEQQSIYQQLPFVQNSEIPKGMIYQKWRLIKNLETQGVKNLNSPELRLLSIYPEALYACAFLSIDKTSVSTLNWKKQVTQIGSIPFMSQSLNCPKSGDTRGNE